MQTVCNTYWDAGKGNLTAQNTRKPFGGRGSAPDPAEGAYSAHANPLVGERGWLFPPQEPHPRCRPFGPRLSYPHSKISPDAVVHSTVSYIDDWPFWSHKSGSSSLRSPQSLSPSQTQALGMHEREAPGAHAQRSSPQPSTEHIHKSKSSSRHRGQSIIQCHSTASGVIIIILPE